MTMRYRKAWLLIQNMQKTFGGDVVVTSIGGRSETCQARSRAKAAKTKAK